MSRKTVEKSLAACDSRRLRERITCDSVACEQALLFGRAKRAALLSPVSRCRISSRVPFARVLFTISPKWRACTQASDSATVNISVFIEQRNISFQNDISLKTMRLGVLSWEKLKHRETHGRIVSLDQLRLGVEEQLLIFSSCLSPGRVKKLQKFINFGLKVGHSANLKHSKSTWRQSSCDSCEMSWNVQNQHIGIIAIAEREQSTTVVVLISGASCGADWFTKSVYIWVTNLHIAVPTITCSLRFA